MRCPACRHDDTRVVDSRAAEGSIRRRRECASCGRRFSTVERPELKLPLVVKKDGRREPFDREKLVAGVKVACRKRPVTAGDIEGAVDSVEQVLLERGGGEVESVLLGRLVLDALIELDPVAWLRFASVYQELENPEAFMDLVRQVTGRGRG